MNWRMNEKIVTSLTVLAMLFGTMIVLPMNSEAAEGKIWGIITDGDGQPIEGADLILTNVHTQSIYPAESSGAGVYFLYPEAAGYYRLMVSKDGYFNNGTDTPFRFDGSESLMKNFNLEKMPLKELWFNGIVKDLGEVKEDSVNNELLSIVAGIATLAHGNIVPNSYTIYNSTATLEESTHYTIDLVSGVITFIDYNISDYHWADYSFYYYGIEGATVSIYNSTYDQIVGEATTDTFGHFNISIWDGSFELRCKAPNYEKNVSSLIITNNYTSDILLNKALKVWGWVFDSDGNPATDVKAYLYCIDTVPQSKRLIEANVDGSFYNFNAFAGNFILIRDADGLEANFTYINITPLTKKLDDVYLQESDKEIVTTNILYNDWDNVTITINRTLNAESCIEGLEVSDMRSARLQIDVAFGNGDGILTQSEVNDFEDWVKNNGPKYVVTNGFLTADNVPYISDSNLDNYIVDVTMDVADMAEGKIWINTTARYNATDIALAESLYNITLYTEHDSLNNLYKNRIYTIELPQEYEMTDNEIMSGNVDVSGYTNLLIDPTIGSGTATIKMTIEKSESGVAKAKIIDGAFYELNDTYENYTAIVSINRNITFSAAESTDIVGDINEANFTWDFNDTSPTEIDYGMECMHNFTIPGEYIVNLTVTETGGNKTYRDITVKVDGNDPIAEIGSNMDIVNDVLYVDEDVEITFNGTDSVDTIYGMEEGVIEWWYWDWESDGLTDKEVHMNEDNDVVHTYTEPGIYNLTLNVTDVIGHRSANRTISVHVNDTTSPTPKFVMLDPEDWEEVQYGDEDITYYFNASETTDNYDDPVNLTYKWEFGDDSTATGMNVSHVFTNVYKSIDIKLNVTDRAGNSANITFPTSINVGDRPDLRVEGDTIDFSPRNPEEGQTITISINITNHGQVDATNVNVKFSYIKDITAEAAEFNISGTVRLYDINGTIITTRIIKVDETVTAKIEWKPPKGNYTVKVNATALNEYFLDDNDNSPYYQISYVNVVEAGWVRMAQYGAIIAVIILVPLIIYILRRKGLLRREIKEKKKKKKK